MICTIVRRNLTTACSGRAPSNSLINQVICAPLMPGVRPISFKVRKEENMSGENIPTGTDKAEAEELHAKSYARNMFGSDVKLRKVATWGAVLGAMFLGGFAAIFLIIQTFKPTKPADNWLITQFNNHFAATIGIPLSALAAFCVVILLRATTGPIEVDSKVIKFHGASGPIIFWILCFIAIVWGVHVLWGKT